MNQSHIFFFKLFIKKERKKERKKEENKQAETWPVITWIKFSFGVSIGRFGGNFMMNGANGGRAGQREGGRAGGWAVTSLELTSPTAWDWTNRSRCFGSQKMAISYRYLF